jgi:hypothetical protein
MELTKMFSYKSWTPDPTVPGKGVLTEVTLLVSLFPYKRGTKFDSIEFDPLNERLVAHRSSKTTSHRLHFTLHYFQK